MRVPLVRHLTVKVSGAAEAKVVEFGGAPVEVKF